MTEGYRQIQNEYINKYRTNNNIYKTGRERRVCDHVGLTPYKPDLAITPGDSKVRLWITPGDSKVRLWVAHWDSKVRLWVAHWDSKVRLWNYTRGNKSQALELHTGKAKVRLWNYTRGKRKSGSGITHGESESQALELHTGKAKVRL